jgi:hypothetical protein
MTDPLDDELRAMLETRAAGASPGAVRDVADGVRAAIHSQDPQSAVGIRPVRVSGRGAWVPAGWMAAALVAVLVIAIGGGRLLPSVASPSASLSTTPVPSSSVPASASAATPVPSAAVASPIILPDPAAVAAFRDALNSGSLDGKLALIDGTLETVAVPCPSPAGPDCFGIAVAGLDGVSITWDGPLSRVKVLGMSGTLAFVVLGDTLVFVGRVDGELAAPTAVAAILASGRPPGGFDLFPVSGWLVVGGIHSCPMIGPGGTPCPGPPPWLTDDRPFEDGMLASNQGTNVTLYGTPVGRPQGQVVTPGPFLVRRVWKTAICDAPSGVDCSGMQWQVVARYDSGSVYRVVLP